MLGIFLVATLLGNVSAYVFQLNPYLLIWGLVGSVVFAGLLLAVRDDQH